MELTELANTLQYLSGSIVAVAYMPQMAKLYRTKESCSISLSAWAMWLVASVFAFFYAFVQHLGHGAGMPLVFSTSLNMLLIFSTLILASRYQRVHLKQ